MFYANSIVCERPWVPQHGEESALFIHRAVTSSRGSGPSSGGILKGSTGMFEVLLFRHPFPSLSMRCVYTQRPNEDSGTHMLLAKAVEKLIVPTCRA